MEIGEKAREIALKCKEIMADPEAHLMKVKDIFGIISREQVDGQLRGIAYLSLLKVFKAVIPLYKVRTLKDMVKDKRDSMHMKAHDKEMLALYTSYIKFIVEDASDESYVSACEVLDHLDHFNCADKIVLKVLVGSTARRLVSRLCCEAIKLKLRNDWSGDTVFLILNQMLDVEHNPLIMEYLMDIPFITNSLKSDDERAVEYWTANARVAKRDKNSIFQSKRIGNKKLKKMDKNRLQMQEDARTEEAFEGDAEEFANRKKIYAALQRLYFTILKENRFEYYKHVFAGLMKYKGIIRPAFREGLYFLLNNNLGCLPSDARIRGIQCIVSLYGEDGYDFKRLVDVLYSALHPMNFDLAEADYCDVDSAARFLFMKTRQPAHRAHVLLNRLILHCCCRPAPMLRMLIRDLSALYSIDPLDCDGLRHKEFDQDAAETDMIPSNPFFAYSLYKQIP